MLSVILWLTLIPAAFAGVVDDPSKLSIPSNFEQCDNLKALYPESLRVPDSAFLDASTGSLTGLADFSTTDSFLRFIDEYVVSNLQSLELRNTLQYHLRLDFAGIDDQISELCYKISSN